MSPTLSRRQLLQLPLLAPLATLPRRAGTSTLLLVLLDPWSRKELLDHPTAKGLAELGTTLQTLEEEKGETRSLPEVLLHAASPGQRPELLLDAPLGAPTDRRWLLSDGPPAPLPRSWRAIEKSAVTRLDLASLGRLQRLARDPKAFRSGLDPLLFPGASKTPSLSAEARNALVQELWTLLGKGSGRDALAAGMPSLLRLLARHQSTPILPAFSGVPQAEAGRVLVAAEQVARALVNEKSEASPALFVVVATRPEGRRRAGACLFAVGPGLKAGRKTSSSTPLRDVPVSLARRVKMKLSDKRGGRLIRLITG